MELKDMTLKDFVRKMDFQNPKGVKMMITGYMKGGSKIECDRMSTNDLLPYSELKQWVIDKVKQIKKEYCKHYPECDHISCDRREFTIEWIKENFNISEEDLNESK